MQDCCRTGFEWNGAPSGKEGRLANNNTYITGDNVDRAILLCHDALGWKFNNTRLLADHYAKEAGATVYLPNFFNNDAVGEDDVWIEIDKDGKASIATNPDLDLGTWFAKHGPDVHMPEVLDCAKQLRSQYNKLAAVGFCWGGSVCFKLASKLNAGLFNCITVAHPGTPTREEVTDISVAFQILAPEHDPPFPAEQREFCCREIPKLGVDFHFQYFPGMVHGFGTKCDENKEREKKALKMAKNAVVFWISTHT